MIANFLNTPNNINTNDPLGLKSTITQSHHTIENKQMDLDTYITHMISLLNGTQISITYYYESSKD
jgi:uncharacterized membrane protein YagU involved in acid resistance